MSGSNTFQFTPHHQQHLHVLQSSDRTTRARGLTFSPTSPSASCHHQEARDDQISGNYNSETTLVTECGDIKESSTYLKFFVSPLREKDAEKSESGSSYSSMEALNPSSSSPLSDSVTMETRPDGIAATFPFESIKEVTRGQHDDEVVGSISSHMSSISLGQLELGQLEELNKSPRKHLNVTPDYLNQEQRRISLPTEVSAAKVSSSFHRHKFFSSARCLGANTSSSSGSSINNVDRLTVANAKPIELGSLDFSSLNKQHMRAHSEGPDIQKEGRLSPLKLIKSSLNLDGRRNRKSSRSSQEDIEKNKENSKVDNNVPHVHTNQKLHASLDPETRSLTDITVETKVSKEILRRSAPFLSERIEEVSETREKKAVRDSDEEDNDSCCSASITSSPTGSIPTVVIHYVKSASSLFYKSTPPSGRSHSLSYASPAGYQLPVACESRTSPAPLTDLTKEERTPGKKAKHHGKLKTGLPRVPSVDSAETVIHLFNTDAASETDIYISQKASDSNDKSSSGQLNLPVTGSTRGSPGPKTSSKSSSGDAGSKVSGKSSSSSSGDKKKKTSSWYNVLSPSYKSRSEDFKRIFKALPSTERLIVEYSCALQKDILIQGRMYVSQNWICFYANIFRWETILMIQCRDITRLTKEKTARVIPNAIQICTRDEKYFFASFGARDKVFVQLDLVRRNALNDVSMNTHEFWSWVHLYYGDDLGLTSDDDDYVPITPEDKSKFQTYLQNELGQNQEPITVEIAKDALFEAILTSPSSIVAASAAAPAKDAVESDVDDDYGTELKVKMIAGDGSPISLDYSECRQHAGLDDEEEDGTESGFTDEEDIVDYCANHSHFNIDVLDEAYNMSVDDVFHHCFSDSNIFKEFVKAKKTFDVKLNPWSSESNVEGQKIRNISYTLTLDFSIGPKHSPSTEKQIMHPESEPGRFYLIDTECINEGIPYGENFFITNRYCISYLSSKRSRLKITSQINYKKHVWGFIKNFLEKNVTAGIITSFSVIADLLRLESDRQLITMATTPSPLQHSLPRKKYTRRRKLVGPADDVAAQESPTHQSTPIKTAGHSRSRTSSVTRFKASSESKPQLSVDSLVKFVCIVLMMLTLFNGILFYKLWSLESTATSLLTAKLQEKQRDDTFCPDKKLFEYPFRKSKHWTLDYKPRSVRKKMWLNSDVDQWKNILSTSIHLMDHMKSSLVELKSNLEDLDQVDIGSETPELAAIVNDGYLDMEKGNVGDLKANG